MKISRIWLQDTLDSSSPDINVVNQISGKSRWSVHFNRVVRYEGKFYRANYSIGATESQDEGAYEYDQDEIECPEVFPVEKIVTVYETRS